jgi:hypothetical protein
MNDAPLRRAPRAARWGSLALLPGLVLAQSDSDSGLGFLFCCYGLVLLVYLALVYWVYSDASGRGNDKAGLWALLVFFTPVIGLLIYFLVGRDQGTHVPPGPPSARWSDDNSTGRF